MPNTFDRSRRRFLAGSAAIGGGALLGLPGVLHAQQGPGIVASDALRPQVDWGLQIGDVLAERAIVWSRADRASRMVVEYADNEAFRRAVRLDGPHALDASDFTARIDLTGLPADEQIFVRVSFLDLDAARAASAPVVGSFRTAPAKRRDVRFLWSGDTAGQGWGSNPDIGGMKIYETMRQTRPDFFIHSGDTIYADNPMLPEVRDAAGSVIWRNAFLDTVPEKLKVAETQKEFHRNYLYNLHDPNVRAFNAQVPQIWQWDDHEVVNNWSDSKDLSADPRYTEKRVQTLRARAGKAFLDYAPLRWNGQDESERVYRRIPFGRDLDVFVIDMRSYRGPNSFNRQEQPGPETAFLGATQVGWLKAGLRDSRATWKVIASDMPLGLIVGDGTDAQGRPRFENIANGNGRVLGREFELAELLSFIKRERICNVVWLTADVHYCAAHFYNPAKAQFQDFDPFWEFVSGPLNAGTFGPNALDDTFGPQVMFQKAPAAGQVNLPPSAGLQFFGQVDIDHRSRDMVVCLKDTAGETLFSQRLQATECRGRGHDED
jgi:alkaline phosphatase D